jgi:hypothetical protein
MIRFHLKGTEVAHNAVGWCTKQFCNEEWNVRMSNRGWDIYDFEFNKEYDATLFGMVWSEHI